MTDEDVVKTLARRFSWPGADLEDVEQEAWFALERCRPKWDPARGRSWKSFAWLCVTSHLTEIQRRECYRRPRLVGLEDRHPGSEDVVDKVESRRLLRIILEHPLTASERRAVDGLLIGEPLGRGERILDNARWRARRKLLAATLDRSLAVP